MAEFFEVGILLCVAALVFFQWGRSKHESRITLSLSSGIRGAQRDDRSTLISHIESAELRGDLIVFAENWNFSWMESDAFLAKISPYQDELIREQWEKIHQAAASGSPLEKLAEAKLAADECP